jgi:hypothetical protein
MRIKYLAGFAGNDFVIEAGEVRECEDAEAERLIDAGFAIPVADEAMERAVATPAEKRRKGR